jgi:hypothetical protein
MELNPEDKNSEMIVEFSQHGIYGIYGKSSAQYPMNSKQETILEIQQLMQNLKEKFPFIETIDYEFSLISPSMVLINIKLDNNAELPKKIQNL